MSDDEAWRAEGRDKLDKANEAWRNGRREDAERLFNELIDQFPDRPEAYNKLGVILAELGSLDLAERWFRTALSVEQDYPPALTNLGNILLERGKTDEAMAYYGLALEKNPDYAQAHRNLAVALRRQGDLRGSVRHLKQGERLAVQEERERTRRRLVGMGRFRGGTTSPGTRPNPRAVWFGGGPWWWVIPLGILVLLTLRLMHVKP